MADMLATALQWHREQLEEHAAQTVTYRRGAFSVELPVTFGSRAATAELAANSLRVEVEQRDFIIPADKLILDGVLTKPCDRDEVELNEDGERRIYRLLPVPDGQAWEYDNDYRKLIVLHTKLICETEDT